LVQDHLPLVDVFVDIGANQGFYSCLAARAGKQVVAIEPEEGNLRFLRANANANEFDIEIYPVAVGARPGNANLYGDGNTASLKQGWLGVSTYFRQAVPVETLDNLIGDRFAAERLLIKIDVEGGEHPVLRGARSLIERKSSAFWLIETFPTGSGEAFADVFHLMWAAGYIAQMADEHLTEVSSEMVQDWADGADFTVSNFFFTHKDRCR
jgi:FkbM family methyltransferase